MILLFRGMDIGRRMRESNSFQGTTTPPDPYRISPMTYLFYYASDRQRIRSTVKEQKCKVAFPIRLCGVGPVVQLEILSRSDLRI